MKELKYFDTHWSTTDAAKLANYLYFLAYNNHVIVVTVGDGFGNMTTRTFDAFSFVGIDISDVAAKGQTFAALIAVGSHCRTVYELHEDDLAYLDLQLNGNYNRHR